jgi:FtsP/CotA-like multicopper oxidase with cupredoxin domain
MRHLQTGAFNRRSVLQAAGGVGTAVAAANLLLVGTSTVGLGSLALGRTLEWLTQPPEIRSANGILQTTITAAPGAMRIGDREFSGLLYDDAYIPPLLRARLGDKMQITFRNNLPDKPSNLHFHGLSVSPQGNSDNVFVHIHPGETFQYEVRIPAAGRQGPGMFWYHPHAHGFVNHQILGGMSGGLVVDGFEQLFPMVQRLPERFFLIKHCKIDEENEVVSVNGQVNPVVAMQAGEMQFWRIAHIGASQFFKFRVEGMPLYVVATDGHALSQPRKVTELFIGPGERVDAIAIGPAPGAYPMRTISFQNEAWRPPEPVLPLAVISSSGSPAADAGLENEVLRQRVVSPKWIDEIRAAAIARRRTLIYSKTADRKVFMIDGRVIDEQRIDQTVKLGDTEEWTIVNTDQQYHSFHIHQTPFLVTEVGGASCNDDSLRDTFSVPPATDQGPGLLKVVIPFTDPVIIGRFVYHCHAVDHEDKGMMGVIQVAA